MGARQVINAVNTVNGNNQQQLGRKLLDENNEALKAQKQGVKLKTPIPNSKKK